MEKVYANQVIRTKYLPASNTRGSRIKAITSSGLSVTIGYPHELSGAMVHIEAVKALIKKHNLSEFKGPFAIGADNEGHYFVPVRATDNVTFLGE